MSTEYSFQTINNDYFESDYEFINNSDSDAEIDSLSMDTHHQKQQTLNTSNQVLHLKDSNVNKFKLNLSQDQIQLGKKSIVENRDTREDEAPTGKRKFSIQPFSIVPISVFKVADKKEDSANLPEIVLTSFENTDKKKATLTNEMKMVNRKLSEFGLDPKPLLPSSSSSNLHFLIDEHSPSPELFLDTQLSAASSVSNRSSRNNSFAMDAYDDSFVSADKSTNNLISRFMYSRTPTPTSASTKFSGNNSGTQADEQNQVEDTIKPHLKCQLCGEVFRDPRVLNCLHSFCFECLVEENFKQDSSLLPFWSQPNQPSFEWKSTKSNFSVKSFSGDSGADMSSAYRQHSPPPTRTDSRSSFASSMRSRKSFDRGSFKDKSSKKVIKTVQTITPTDKPRTITCPTCQYRTDVPIGGIRQLPVNFVLLRKIDIVRARIGNVVLSKLWCSLCNVETAATYHCITCTVNLCTYCKDAHERQKQTANHQVNNIIELRKQKKLQKNLVDDSKYVVKCSMHPEFEMKSFCVVCLQVVCSDCLILLHKGHKAEPIGKAFKSYYKVLRESTERAKPLCEYTEQSIMRLNEIAKRISYKCDQIQAEVEGFILAYNEAVEFHARTLRNQIARAKETKIQMILENQLDMEKRAIEAEQAVRFSQELIDDGTEAEILSIINIILKRFEFCQKFQPPLDPKISDTLNFLPDIRAPATKEQNNIPMFGILTTQVVAPQFCTLESDACVHLRVHKLAELVILSRDADGLPMCHGGLSLNVKVKYKEGTGKCLPVEVSDKRDGTYCISFTPDSPGNISLSVAINDRQIKGSPFTLAARAVRPHNGIFHCCAFCSSKGSKMAACACNGKMPKFNGCGHGHFGHPGRRHWSCCGNVLENSECTSANKLLTAL